MEVPNGKPHRWFPGDSGQIPLLRRDDGNVYAVDVETGRQVWKTRTRGPVPCTPAIANGTVYIGSYDGKFYALNSQTGAVKWKFATEGERRFEAKGLHGMQPKTQTIADPFDVFLSSPVVAEGAVYFGSGDGNLYALDAMTGEQRWRFKTGDVVHASPALANGVLFVGSWDSYFYAIDARAGKRSGAFTPARMRSFTIRSASNRRLRWSMESSTPDAGTRSSTPLTPPLARKNGSSTTSSAG